MHRAEFENRYRQFLAARKVWSAPPSERPASEAEVAEFERRHGVLLPEPHRVVLTTIGSGDIGFAKLYSVHDSEFSLEHQLVPSHLGPGFLPISDNGCGDFYGFTVVGGRCDPAVYFADHESGYALQRTDMGDTYEFLVALAFSA